MTIRMDSLLRRRHFTDSFDYWAKNKKKYKLELRNKYDELALLVPEDKLQHLLSEVYELGISKGYEEGHESGYYEGREDHNW